MKKERKIPTILGLLLLIISIVVGLYLTGSRTSFRSSASGDCMPVGLQITNITNNSADISFTTVAKCLSAISIDNRIIEDVRSLNSSSQVPSNIQYFQIKSLKSNADYHFDIISGNQTFSDQLYSITTGDSPKSPMNASDLAWGRVMDSDMKPATDAIVYLSIPGAGFLSSFVTSNGNWSISLANSFNDAGNDWFVPPTTPVEEDIIVISADGMATQIVNSSATNNPVPDIIIGQDSLSLSEETTGGNYGQFSDVDQVMTGEIDILNPKNGEIIDVNRPDFFGLAPVNSTVIIEVHSDETINGQAQSDTSGLWHWSPPQNLSPGEHSITIRVQNPVTGIWQSITRVFTVLAADNNGPAYEASGSATTITISPSLTPTSIPSPTSTASILPTATTTPSVSPSPTPTVRTAPVSTESATPPITGNAFPTVLIVTFALLFFIISFKFIK